jgi:SnoaL-like domain
VTRDDVNGWLKRYVAAWKSNHPDEIGELFSADASYRYYPSAEPLVGRDAIVQGWLSEGDEPGTFDASYSCWVLDGDRAVATGTSSYTAPEHRVYDNVFLLVFDGEGRCADFSEVYVRQPSDA